MRVVVLGDLHFYQLAVWPWQLFSKRLLGQTNLWFHRRRHFKPALWPGLRDRIIERKPDALLCSGDFVTTALPGEFRTASQAWSELVDAIQPSEAFVVPGNHDRYTYTSKRKQLFEAAFAPWTSQEWPATKALGPKHQVIALDPTRPNPFNASGELGPEQQTRLKEVLEAIPSDQAIFILCHYPIGTPPELPKEAPGHGLQDTEALVQLLAEAKRPITYLHGHIHWPWKWVPKAAPNVSAINVGAPMLTSSQYPMGQGFLEMELPEAGSEQELTFSRQCLSKDGQWQQQDSSGR